MLQKYNVSKTKRQKEETTTTVEEYKPNNPKKRFLNKNK